MTLSPSGETPFVCEQPTGINSWLSCVSEALPSRRARGQFSPPTSSKVDRGRRVLESDAALRKKLLGSLSRQRLNADRACHRYDQDVINQCVLRAERIELDEMSDRATKESLGVVAFHGRKDNHAGMQLDARCELAEIVGVLSDDDAILVDRELEDGVIRFPQSTSIPRMDRVVFAGGVEGSRQRRGNAFVDEKSHAAPPGFRAAGRPTRGCVLPKRYAASKASRGTSG